ncbi:MAG: sodium:alanine symporter family protein [Lachnospiraceae bacterium]|nr:sodium:alanine symporter family protein [Lachnospiraceae bacterium]
MSFFEQLTSVNDVINTFIWTKIGVWLLIGSGIILTCCTRFFQVSHLKHWWRNTIGSLFHKKVIGHTKEKAISPFQALCTALAATIGTGNIAGVAAAICIGGAGAVFWMWIAAFFGMMTNYSENILGIYYRRRNSEGEWSGGAMYYIRDGLGNKKGCKGVAKVLAVLFSVFAVLASFGIGCMSQVNKIVANISEAFDIKALSDITVFESGDNTVTLYSIIIGVIIMILAGLIILGGLKRIAGFAEKVVPFMVVAFVLGSLIIIGSNYAHILPAFKAIFVNAFSPISALGGGVGFVVSKVMTQGFKRGVFSNEAGLGSSVMVHSNSNVIEPVQQGMWGIFEVFADTMIVCTMTALVILTSGVYNLATGEIAASSDAVLVGAAFDSVFSWGHIGSKFIAIAMFLFAFTTVLGWSHYGAKAWEYLFGTKSTIIFKILHIIMIMFGAVLTSSLAWDISDTFNGFMMIPNLIGVLSLSGLVIKLTKNYVDRNLHNKAVKPMLSAFPDIQAVQEKKLKEED